MATSTRPRRAAAPASAEHPARSDDSAAKKPAAKKKTPAKKNAAEVVAAPAGRKAAAKKVAAPARTPETEPAAVKPAAAKKAAAKPAPARKRAPAGDAAPTSGVKAQAEAPDRKSTEAPPAGRKAAAKGPAAKAPATKAPSARSSATKAPATETATTKPAATRQPAAKAPATQPPATAKAPARKTAAPPAAKKTGRGRPSPATTATTATTAASEEQAARPDDAPVEAASPALATATHAAMPADAAHPQPVPVPAVQAAAAPSARTPARAADAPPYSAVVLQGDDHRQLRWIAGSTCPEALHAVATACTDEAGLLQLDNDDALPTLLREAAAAGHALQVDPAAWQHLARRRDARQRLFVLEHAYPEGPACPSLQQLLRAPLAPFQAEGALFAACAGRALLADERGLGKTVQALAAAVLLHRHAGVERVLIHCNADQRLSWQREAARFLGAAAPDWRVVSDEPGGPHAEAIDAWKPGLVVIDEPARLARWNRIDAPFALVLCGTPLEDDAPLVEALVDYLDRHREGPLARLRARADGDALDDTLQALMLRRRRADVAPQLPTRVASERVLPLGPLQRAVHDRAATGARTVLAAWRRTRHLTDAQQWELGSAMQAMRDACHRAEPGQPDSPLAEHTLAALDVLTSELLGHAGLRMAVIAPRPDDATQLATRLAQAGPRCTVVAAGAPLPDAAEVVIAIGMPWAAPAADERPRHWIHLVADQSIDTALYDTRELRTDVASTPAEGGHHGFLHGAALQRYLLAVEAALRALPDQLAS